MQPVFQGTKQGGLEQLVLETPDNGLQQSVSKSKMREGHPKLRDQLVSNRLTG